MMFKVTALLDVDPSIYNPDYEEESAWFHSLLYGEGLFVRSNEIGDDIGTMRIQSAVAVSVEEGK